MGYVVRDFAQVKFKIVDGMDAEKDFIEVRQMLGVWIYSVLNVMPI